MSPETPYAFVMQGIRKTFRYFQLEGFDLSLPLGQIMGLVGPNGAGKSTTIRLLMGLIAPEAPCVRTTDFQPAAARPVIRGHKCDPPRLHMGERQSNSPYRQSLAALPAASLAQGAQPNRLQSGAERPVLNCAVPRNWTLPPLTGSWRTVSWRMSIMICSATLLVRSAQDGLRFAASAFS
jgi:energy-coupling factor transporter ATP-binding protein EcfA2